MASSTVAVFEGSNHSNTVSLCQSVYRASCAACAVSLRLSAKTAHQLSQHPLHTKRRAPAVRAIVCSATPRTTAGGICSGQIKRFGLVERFRQPLSILCIRVLWQSLLRSFGSEQPGQGGGAHSLYNFTDTHSTAPGWVLQNHQRQSVSNPQSDLLTADSRLFIPGSGLPLQQCKLFKFSLASMAQLQELVCPISMMGCIATAQSISIIPQL